MQEDKLLLQVGVKALLRNSEGKYLLLHRSKEKYPEVKNAWDIPGGRIDAGTGLLENLRREIKEETGLELVNDPIFTAVQDIIRNDKHVVRITYVGMIDGEPKLDSEHDSYQWFTYEELQNLVDLDSYVTEILSTIKR